VSVFWEWALDAYARPGVAEACLELQDVHGQNVPLLLWAAWAAADALEPDVERGAALARAFEAAAGERLREARRALKQPLPGLGDDEREAFRRRLKAVELEGERTLMAALAALAPAGRPQDRRALLVAAAQAYGAPLPGEAFDALLARL
jgi:uncharacterized protein (TIGR02444 family)